MSDEHAPSTVDRPPDSPSVSPEDPVDRTGRRAIPPSLDALVADHHVGLVRLAHVLCGDVSEAEDLVADAYARAWPRIRSGTVDDPASYLRRCVLNATSSWKRRRSVAHRHLSTRTAARGDPAVEGRVDDQDLLGPALRALPLAQRQVVALRYLEDLSEEDTAHLLGVPPGTVKSRAARALQALRDYLGEEALR